MQISYYGQNQGYLVCISFRIIKAHPPKFCRVRQPAGMATLPDVLHDLLPIITDIRIPYLVLSPCLSLSVLLVSGQLCFRRDANLFAEQFYAYLFFYHFFLFIYLFISLLIYLLIKSLSVTECSSLTPVSLAVKAPHLFQGENGDFLVVEAHTIPDKIIQSLALITMIFALVLS